MREWVIVVLFVLGLLSGCQEGTTQVLVVVHLDERLAMDQLAVSARNSRRAFPEVRRPETASASPLAEPQSIALLLPDDMAELELTVTVVGLRRGMPVATRSDTVFPHRGRSVTMELWLGTSITDLGLESNGDSAPRDQLEDTRRRDGGPDLPRPDVSIVDGPRPDRRDSTAPDTTRDTSVCSPNAFLSCSGITLTRCNASGTGWVTESCVPFLCNTNQKRCNVCDPASTPACSGGNLVSCTVDGLIKTTPCPLGCSKNACCLDQDNDQSTDCAGDCDDTAPDVFPQQTAFFTTPRSGTTSFDYDCDSMEEMEFDSLEGCSRLGADCTGHGWQNTVPSCGNSGTFITCKPTGPSSCSRQMETKSQACH